MRGSSMSINIHYYDLPSFHIRQSRKNQTYDLQSKSIRYIVNIYLVPMCTLHIHDIRIVL